MKIQALIPARSGSKRVKEKNIRPLGDWPLMRWTVEVAKQSGLFERVVVSSDSQKYLEMAQEWGAEGIMRPPELSGDDSGDSDVFKNFLERYQPDLIAYLRPTTPFRTPTLLREAIEEMKAAGDNATSMRSVELMGESSWKTFEIRWGFLHPIVESMTLANMPNQALTPTYRGNGYIDIVKSEQALIGELWGKRCIGFITPTVIEIDDEYDFWLAEQWLARERKFGYGREEL